MKKILFVISTMFLILTFYSCGTSKVESVDGDLDMNMENDAEQPEKGRPMIGGGVQIPNPYYTFSTLEEAAEMAGFSMTLPAKEDLPDWIIRTDYRATKENLMEIIYPGDENYEREIRFRKAITDKEDMSGDYNSYEKEDVINVAGRDVTVRINGDKIYGAIWRDGEFAYSAHISDGISEEELVKIIKVIK